MPVTATPTRAAEFRETLAQRVWVADGAMGTMLYSKGAFINRCYDELNLSLPALVRDVHQEYVRAGAEIIETNTFGANRKRLAPFGFADKVRLINRAGVRIAREAARDQAFVAAAIGPLGVRLEPLGSTTIDEARSIFREQIEALVEAGVDCLMLETFRDLNEVRAAVEAAREAAGPEMVLMAHLSIEDDGRLQDGTSIEDFTRALDAMPVDVIGLNCSSGPKVMLETLEKMGAYTTSRSAPCPTPDSPPASTAATFICARPSTWRNTPRALSRPARGSSAAAAEPRRSTSRKSAMRFAACNRRSAVSVDRLWTKPPPSPRRWRKSRSRTRASWAPSSRPGRSSPLSKSFRRAAWTLPRKSPERSCARKPGSTASTFPTVLAPAPVSAPRSPAS